MDKRDLILGVEAGSILRLDRVAFNMRVYRGQIPVVMYDAKERPLFDRVTIQALAFAAAIVRDAKAAKKSANKKKASGKKTSKKK